MRWDVSLDLKTSNNGAHFMFLGIAFHSFGPRKAKEWQMSGCSEYQGECGHRTGCQDHWVLSLARTSDLVSSTCHPLMLRVKARWWIPVF